MLGGLIGRKGDGKPGVNNIWLGLQVVRNAIHVFDILSDVAPEV